MSRFHSYISSAIKIIESYDNGKPLSYHLKNFFSAQKKYGSRDRKTIASLCYNYFRLGAALKNEPAEERILAGLFLAENKSNEVLALLRPHWNGQVNLTIDEKLALSGIDPAAIFPFQHETGNNIDNSAFAISFLNQPDLFLRLRPGKKRQVIEKLNNAPLSFEPLTEDCLKFTNNTSLDNVLDINKEAVIQDYNSQLVLDFIKQNPAYFPVNSKISAWDCCAASGGKSILMFDILKGNLKLTVSDIRENILANLVKRLEHAGINIYRKFVTDLSKRSSLSGDETFSIILCDAPCTGSGTWSRTPEQLFNFDKNSIAVYAERQKKIISNALPHLAAGGFFFYITCSVFKEENEVVVEYIKEKFHLQVLQMEYLRGYNMKADTMFVAVLSL
ncbi:MAG: Fmu (Sun) domain-containing protein [Ferruginibacter sp.]